MTELKPCPFCGGEARLIEDENHTMDFRRPFYVCCSGCEIQTPPDREGEISIIEWNTRQPHQAIKEVYDKYIRRYGTTTRPAYSEGAEMWIAIKKAVET